ncbi:helix-turn-helix transcriptional regulator [bacterium AH-315-M10]|nr:helix-turn-helix transcriptional regulator [bacterium AH-315-M10]
MSDSARDVAVLQLGSVIRAERSRRGLTQTQLGDLAGAGLNFIGQIEQGKSSARIGMILDVLHVLGFELTIGRGKDYIKVPEVIGA